MVTIVKFLTARLDEYQAAAEFMKAREDEGLQLVTQFVGRRLADDMLADIAAKRAIMKDYERAHENRRAHPDDLASAGALLTLLGVIKQLASVYAEHPDYQQEWKS